MTQDNGSSAQAYKAYTAKLDDGEAPLLGHLVLFSVYESEITQPQLEQWFTELGLDEEYLPPPLRNVDAFERVTGPNGVKVTYPLADPTTAYGAVRAARGRAVGNSAQLMVRPVRRDGGQIIRHVVREVRDEEKTALRYDSRVAVCTFNRDNEASEEGAGALEVEPDSAALATLPDAEQANVRAMLAEIEEQYAWRCRFLDADKLRGVVRKHIESLNAVRIRSGAYFVHAQYADTVAALRTLVSRFGGNSILTRIPLLDQDEQREMVINAFTTKARDDLDKLAKDIATYAQARREGKRSGDGDVQKLYDRFARLQQDTAQHADLLSTSLADTNASLDLVKMQLGSLLATAGGDDDGQDAAGDAGATDTAGGDPDVS